MQSEVTGVAGNSSASEKMASMITRAALNTLRRSVFSTGFRPLSSHGGHGQQADVDPHLGKLASDECSLPDGLGHSVGVDRMERLAEQWGIEDPWDMHMKVRTKGTKEAPNVVYCDTDYRLVGCICEEDSIAISWMNLHKGESKRCSCGYWFKAVNVEEGAAH